MSLETIAQHTHRGDSSFDPAEGTVRGGPVDLDGRRFYRIEAYDQMPPFFMTIVGASDVWLFISSTGGLTAGRVDADRALFPYYTDDKVTESAGRTGGLSVLLVGRGDGTRTHWQPFSELRPGDAAVQRTLYKDALGTTLVFEETRPDLGLRLRVTWQTSARFGVVRSCALTSLADESLDVELLDGLVNILPAGAGKKTQNELSVLLDAYKRAELDRATGLGLLTLSATLSDLAEPSESLQANVAWQVGLGNAGHLLSVEQVDAFARGRGIIPETDVRGQRGAYLVQSRITLSPGSTERWQVVADVNQDAADVVSLRSKLQHPDLLATELAADISDTRSDLETILAATDASQSSGDQLATMHHTANVLFNTMRGGVPAEGYTVEASDVRAFVAQRSHATARRCSALLGALPERLRADELVALAQEDGDVDLWRLCMEYLPLTFSRRHGDPSRPWNQFSITLRDEHGARRLEYQGNWRDIFQNWEALALSYPDFVEAMLFKFADSSTVDGHNPYRVLREGFEWELLDPDDDWANIGYWGDHQVIYLLRLLEVAERYRPGSLTPLLTRKVFTFADVPYRIRPYEDLLRDPRNTIDFDDAVNAAALERASRIGSDGKAALDADGELLRANLTEKLLIVVLSKLSNFVPGVGIWMNTMRPEWNDANNALVGNGVSMVTLSYVRRYLAFLDAQFDSSGLDEVEISAPVAEFLRAVTRAFEDHADLTEGAISDGRRKKLLDQLGAAGTAYRARAYDEAQRGPAATVVVSEIRGFIAAALGHVDHSIAANRRDDGLYHSYNIMLAKPEGIAVRRLSEMLEGQVAVLSCGLLGTAEIADLLDALRSSELFRADQNSYILYPDHELPHFLEKNVVPADEVANSALLTGMIDRGDTRIVARDVEGGVHFNAAFRNGGHLDEALTALGDGEHGPLTVAERARVLDLYEEVFQHASFTGRSGTFYKYEGLGSIYWHMVSKLLLAVDEARLNAIRSGASAADIERLERHYEQIRDGIGVHKSPAEYGAVPTDPYSHTPSFSGVQQPGMTGQVKEDLITRASEMGVVVTVGEIHFEPRIVRSQEFLESPSTLNFIGLDGEPASLALDAGTMGFTLCQVPVVLHRGGTPGIVVTRDGVAGSTEGLSLDLADSVAIFDRTGRISRLDVTLGLAD